jgi:hypothetical protein
MLLREGMETKSAPHLFRGGSGSPRYTSIAKYSVEYTDICRLRNMKAMEWLVLVAGGAALFFVAENNLPQLKEGISRIRRKISSQFIPVSTS